MCSRAQACGDQRISLGVLPQDTAHSIHLQAAELSRLTGQETLRPCLLASVSPELGFQGFPYNNLAFYVGSGVPNQVLMFMWQEIFRLSYMPSSRELLLDRVPWNYTVTAPGYTDREDFPPLLQSTMDNVCCAWWRDTLQEREDWVCPTEEHELHMGMGNLNRGE